MCTGAGFSRLDGEDLAIIATKPGVPVPDERFLRRRRQTKWV